ncbi:hypothetical protein ERO13_D09G230800v2 [Gossypium hirsutum]|nr:hypothetical protein ERO13_D09G230800v2 [Gossypium hirsutum]
MPPLNLAKKLKPAKKAWKSFTIKVRSKLESFDVSNSIKTVTRRVIEFCSVHLFAPFKKRFLRHSSGRGRRRPFNHEYDHLYHYQHYRNQVKNNRKVIYIDQLYGEQRMEQQPEAVAETSRRNEEVAEESGVYSIEDAWKAVVARSPHLRELMNELMSLYISFVKKGSLRRNEVTLIFKRCWLEVLESLSSFCCCVLKCKTW